MLSHITVIDPAVRVAELDCFNFLARQSPLPMTYHLPAMFGLNSLRLQPETVAGIIVLGSSTSVNEEKPWQKGLADWLRPLLERGVPTLGLCYGHQLLAHLYGAEVGFAFPDQKKFEGWRRVQLQPSPLTEGKACEGQLLASHREIVTQCPTGWRIVGRSPEVAIEALAHEQLPIWTFQSHPEATPGFLYNLGFSPAENVSLFSFGHQLIRFFLEKAGGDHRRS